MFEFALTGITPYNRSVYFSLLEDYNSALWPVHIIAVITATYIVYKFIKADQNTASIVVSILGVSWIIVGYFFFLKSYLTINWAAEYFAYIFIIQGLFFLICGFFLNITLVTVSNKWIANSLNTLGCSLLLLYPLSGLFDGRTFKQLEVFMLTPDITALFTLMFLMLIKEKWKYLLIFVPATWLIISISSAISLELFQWQFMLALLFFWIFLVGLIRYSSKSVK